MICSSVNLVRFIVRPQVGSDSNRWWRKNPVAGQILLLNTTNFWGDYPLTGHYKLPNIFIHFSVENALEELKLRQLKSISTNAKRPSRCVLRKDAKYMLN